MTSIAVTGVQNFSAVTCPVPAPGPGQALVKVAYCGICGSDVPRYFDGAVHAFPQILGHEFSGVVAAAGPGCGTPVGTRVAVAPHIPCGQCGQCRDANPTLCEDYSFIGSREPGAMAQYVLAPSENLVPAGGLSLRSAALVEPLTVALHAVNQVDVRPGLRAVVLGSGVIGLMSVLSLRDRGVEDITVVDINPWVLDVARSMGACRTINPAAQDTAAVLSGEAAPGLVLETAGAAATIRQALQLAARRGRIVYVGKPTRPFETDIDTFEQILRKELTIKGSWLSYSSPFPGSEWTDAVRVLQNSPVSPEGIVTHEFGLGEAADGFEVMRGTGVRRLKVMFRVFGEDA
ncbi:galactitol-1-phosphate 5-dehydrogenase [Propionibacterium australiense]|nr:galactitol-1-phosphate 5-dehydrogenase [Propionibacterium australiense]RLP06718.1 galactitol-1-phosphate 5-dehydrogenase [Propionibacterium australiense]